MRLPSDSHSCIAMGCRRANRVRENGIMLMEALVYVALLALMLGLALGAFYTALANNRNLTRNADDITRTLKAGERWRADIREATSAPRVVEGATVSNVVLRLPHGQSEIVYSLRDGEITRRGPGETNEVPLLSGVARAEFVREPRTHVTTWRWEVELAGRQKVAGIRPLFTFQAVENPEGKR